MAKKMILIDPRLLESMNQKTYVPPDTLNDNLRDLDNQMQQILEREDLSPRDKVKQYQQILQLYTFRLGEYKQKPLGLLDMKPQPTAPLQSNTPTASDQQQQKVDVEPKKVDVEPKKEETPIVIPESTKKSKKQKNTEKDKITPPQPKRTRKAKSTKQGQWEEW